MNKYRDIPLADPTPELIQKAQNAVKHSDAEAGAVVWVDRTRWWRWANGKSAMDKGLFELYLIKTGQR